MNYTVTRPVFGMMLLWLGLSFSLITVDYVQAQTETDIHHGDSDGEAPAICGDAKVLLKVWDLLSSLLDSDSETVTAPTKDQIHYALTLIKKALLEAENQSAQILDALFMNEVELGEKKGIHLDNTIPLTNLLQSDLSQNPRLMDNYKLGRNPYCKEAFTKLVQRAHEERAKLVKSPLCNGDNIQNPGNNVQPLRQSLNVNNVYNPRPDFNHLAYSKVGRDMNFARVKNDETQQHGNFDKPMEAQTLTNIPDRPICGDSRVLFKIWNLLSSLIDSDTKTVKAPTRDQIHYALTIIKKALSETENQNPQVLGALFMNEVQLGEKKGIHLNDNRPLKKMLELELSDDPHMLYKYTFGKNPYCKEAFTRFVTKAREEHDNLVKSPICSDNINPAKNIQRDRVGPSNWNKPTDSNLQLVDKIIKNYQESNFNIDLEHAKNVADVINNIYKTNNSPDLHLSDMNHEKPTVDTNLYNDNTGTVNMQSSYLNQNYNLNLPNNTPPGMLNQGTIHSNSPANIMQTLESEEDTSSSEQDDSSSENVFVNSKYHPKHDHHNHKTDITPLSGTVTINNNQMLDESNIPTKLNLRENYPNLQQNIGNEPGKPIRTGVGMQYNNLYYSDNNPNYAENYQSSQNNYPYQQSNVQSFYSNYPQNPLSSIPVLQSSYSSYAVQKHRNPYVNKLIELNRYPYSNNVLATNYYMNAPRQSLGNLNNNPQIQNVGYTSTSFTNTVPDKLSYAANYNNNKAIMDTLAKWISGTNPSKLNSAIDNSNSEIELTYLIKKPPLLLPATYFLKFRLPYATFTKHLYGLLNSQHLRSSDNDLYKELVSNFNATVIKPESNIPQEAINQMEESSLVKARLIEPGPGDAKYKVNIANVVKEGLDGSNVDFHTNDNGYGN